MSTLALLAFLAGAVLGTRFKVLVLVPAIGLTIAAALARGVIAGDSASWVAITAFAAATCMQIGYLGGLVARHATMLDPVGPGKDSLRSTSAAPGHSTRGAPASTQYRG